MENNEGIVIYDNGFPDPPAAESEEVEQGPPGNLPDANGYLEYVPVEALGIEDVGEEVGDNMLVEGEGVELVLALPAVGENVVGAVGAQGVGEIVPEGVVGDVAEGVGAVGAGVGENMPVGAVVAEGAVGAGVGENMPVGAVVAEGVGAVGAGVGENMPVGAIGAVGENVVEGAEGVGAESVGSV